MENDRSNTQERCGRASLMSPHWRRSNIEEEEVSGPRENSRAPSSNSNLTKSTFHKIEPPEREQHGRSPEGVSERE